MERGVGEKLLRALRLNECPEIRIGIMRFHLKCLEQTLFSRFTNEEQETEQGRARTKFLEFFICLLLYFSLILEGN